MRHVLSLLGKVLLLILVVVVCVAVFWLGPLVKYSLQSVAPAFLGTSLTMESLSINLANGTVHLKELHVGNYKSFKQPDLLSVKEVVVEVDMTSLFRKTLVVKNVVVDQPRFVYEQNGATDNIGELLANLAVNSDSKENGGLDQYDEPPGASSVRHVLIERFMISEASVLVANTKNPELDIELGVKRAYLAMRDGHICLNGLSISNPHGFVSKHVFELPMFGIYVDPESIYSDQIVVKDILFDSPQLFLERSSQTTNVDQILKLITAVLPRFEKPPKEPESLLTLKLDRDDVEEKQPVTFVIQQIRLNSFLLSLLDSSDASRCVCDEALSVSDVLVRPEEGSIQMLGVYLLNPSGFVSPAFLGLKEFSLRIDPASLQSGRVVVSDVKVDSPYVTLEQYRGSSNLAVLQQRAGWFIPERGAVKEPSKVKKTKKEIEPAPRTVMLESLVMDDFKVKMLRSGESVSLEDASTLLGVKQVRFSGQDGVAGVNELYVCNPAGYTTPNLFELSEVNVRFDPASMGSTQLVVNSVQVAPIYVNLEQTPSSANLIEVIAFFESLIPKKEESTAATQRENEKSRSASARSSSPPFVLQQVDFDGGLVQLISMPTEDASKSVVQLAGFDTVTVLPEKGLLEVAGFFIGNPQQFPSSNLFEMETLFVKTDPLHVYAGPLTLDTVLVKNPVVHLERIPDGLNVPILIKRIKGVLPVADTSAPRQQASGSDSATQSPVLKRLVVEGAELRVVHAPEVGDSRESSTFASVGKLMLQLDEGRLAVTNIYVGNPPEFANPALLEASSLQVRVDPASLTSDVMLVKDVLIDDMVVAYERQLMSDNIQVLQERIGAFFAMEAPAGSVATESVPSSATSSDDEGKVIIEHLRLRDGRVLVKLSVLPAKLISLSFEMNDIGKDTGGAGLVELSSLLFSVFYKNVLSTVGSMTDVASGALKGAGGFVGGAVTDPEGTLKGAGDSIVDLGKGITGTAVDMVKKPLSSSEKEEGKEGKAAE